MNESLLRLYELQKIDSELDELLASRGGLPERVAEMRADMAAREDELATIRDRAARAEHDMREFERELAVVKEKFEGYKAQQFDVKTTREYDAITFQIEDANRRIREFSDNMARARVEFENSRGEAEEYSAELEGIRAEFEDSERALNELITETIDEETRLRAERDRVAVQVSAPHMALYERIRFAKDGIGVVGVRNGVCGGCFNAIPRQLVMELRRGDKHTVCEACGRIVVGETIALAIDGEPQTVTQDVEVEEEQEQNDQ